MGALSYESLADPKVAALAAVQELDLVHLFSRLKFGYVWTLWTDEYHIEYH